MGLSRVRRNWNSWIRTVLSMVMKSEESEKDGNAFKLCRNTYKTKSISFETIHAALIPACGDISRNPLVKKRKWKEVSEEGLRARESIRRIYRLPFEIYPFESLLQRGGWLYSLLNAERPANRILGDTENSSPMAETSRLSQVNEAFTKYLFSGEKLRDWETACGAAVEWRRRRICGWRTFDGSV